MMRLRFKKLKKKKEIPEKRFLQEQLIFINLALFTIQNMFFK
jgi:hypothetical protein